MWWYSASLARTKSTSVDPWREYAWVLLQVRSRAFLLRLMSFEWSHSFITESTALAATLSKLRSFALGRS